MLMIVVALSAIPIGAIVLVREVIRAFWEGMERAYGPKPPIRQTPEK
jgi:hypothetical protein